MPNINSYKDLRVWQQAMELVLECYRISAAFPASERYGLTLQLRKSAVSIPSNIAEGRGRSSTREFIQFLSIAHGSLAELETQLLIAEHLGYCDPAPTLEFADRLSRHLHALKRSLRSRIKNR